MTLEYAINVPIEYKPNKSLELPLCCVVSKYGGSLELSMDSEPISIYSHLLDHLKEIHENLKEISKNLNDSITKQDIAEIFNLLDGKTKK